MLTQIGDLWYVRCNIKRHNTTAGVDTPGPALRKRTLDATAKQILGMYGWTFNGNKHYGPCCDERDMPYLYCPSCEVDMYPSVFDLDTTARLYGWIWHDDVDEWYCAACTVEDFESWDPCGDSGHTWTMHGPDTVRCIIPYCGVQKNFLTYPQT